LPPLPDQEGLQEIEPRVGPHTYLARYARGAGQGSKQQARQLEIERLDFLASVELLEARDTVLNRGFVDTDIRAREYRLTVAGWLAGIGECLHLGRIELLRALDYTESAPGPNGFRTLKVRTLVGVRYPPEWARSDEARRLFPAVKQHHEGVMREETLYRDPQGRIDTSSTYIGSLKHLHSEEQVRAREALDARLTVEVANKILASLPLGTKNADGHGAPAPCLDLFPGHRPQSPSLFTRADNGVFTVQIPGTMSGSGVDRAVAHAQVRAMRLADAGLAALETPRDADGRSLRLRLSPQFDALFLKHGACLPLGATVVELVGIGTSAAQEARTRPRIYARAQVTKRADWTRSTPAFLWLPDLANMLQSGILFEVDVYLSQTDWKVERVSALAPSWILPRLDAIGESRSWHAGYLRQKGVSAAIPSTRTHALHVLAAHEGTRREGSDAREIEVDVQPMARPAILVLSAYGPIEWRFRVAPNARIGAVLAFGYHPQSVSGLPANVPLVSAAHSDGMTSGPTTLGRVRPQDVSLKKGGPGVDVTFGPGGPKVEAADRQVIDRGVQGRLVTPDGILITEQGKGHYEVRSLNSAASDDVVSAETVARMRELFGVAPATVNYSYTGSRFVVDGRTTLPMEASDGR